MLKQRNYQLFHMEHLFLLNLIQFYVILVVAAIVLLILLMFGLCTCVCGDIIRSYFLFFNDVFVLRLGLVAIEAAKLGSYRVSYPSYVLDEDSGRRKKSLVA